MTRRWHRLSIIIPTDNNGDNLARCLTALQPALDAFMVDIIITDGGSTDISLKTATMFETNIIHSSGDIAQRMEEAVALKAADWYLFLHPDTRLDNGWHNTIIDYMEDPKNYRLAGYFRPQLATKHTPIFQSLIRLRAKIFGKPYIEQGLLLSHHYFEELGGFNGQKPNPWQDFIARIGWANLEEINATATALSDFGYIGKGKYLQYIKDFFRALFNR